MSRSDLERLNKEELIELVMRLHQLEKTSRTSSKPPAIDRKERRKKSRPGGAKLGHEGHERALTPDPDQVVEHRPASRWGFRGVEPQRHTGRPGWGL